MNPIRFISEKINQKPKDKYNILTFSTHEAYQETMAKTGHNFYLLEPKGGKTWNDNFRKLPSNCKIIKDTKKIPYDIDILLSQERYGQLQYMVSLSNSTRIPLIHIDHVEPIKDENFQTLLKFKADQHVFITDHNKQSWGVDGQVIKHGIDTELFSGWKHNNSKKVVYTVNYLQDRDFFCGWREWSYIKAKVAKIDPEIEFILIGDNPGISRPISDKNELVNKLKSCACYINTSKFSPVPMSLLEAMSCGMPIVSTRYQQVSQLLDHKNAISSNNPDMLADAVVNICNNNELFADMGTAARQHILDEFSVESFIKNWNDLFTKIYNQRLSNPHEVLYI